MVRIGFMTFSFQVVRNHGFHDFDTHNFDDFFFSHFSFCLVFLSLPEICNYIIEQVLFLRYMVLIKVRCFFLIVYIYHFYRSLRRWKLCRTAFYLSFVDHWARSVPMSQMYGLPSSLRTYLC